MTMEITARDFSYLVGKVPLSNELLSIHFKLYEGYVSNTATLQRKLEEMSRDGKLLEPEYAELKRRFAWEWNGVRLHELYFENLGGNGDTALAPRVVDVIKASFGDFDAWKEDLLATAKMRGIGWVVVYFDEKTGAVFNAWINEHNESHLAGLKPLIVIDVFEHAFLLDYGLNRAEYLEKIFGNLNWQVIEARL
jgi:Fe-Mn family superoxide dismutase